MSAPKFDLTRNEICHYFESRLQRKKLLPNRKQINVKCPFHRDRVESLSIDLERGLWKCHAGCGEGGLIAFEMKLTSKSKSECWKAIFETIGREVPQRKREVVKTYPYEDENGNLLFQVLRYKPKSFSQRRPAGNGGWIWNVQGVTLVPFHLPALIPATHAIVVEGEGDVLKRREGRSRIPN